MLPGSCWAPESITRTAWSHQGVRLCDGMVLGLTILGGGSKLR